MCFGFAAGLPASAVAAGLPASGVALVALAALAAGAVVDGAAVALNDGIGSLDAAAAVSGGIGGAGGGTLSPPPHAHAAPIASETTTHPIEAIRMAACTRQMR